MQKQFNKLNIEMLIIVANHNYQQIEEMLEVAGGLGVNCGFDLVRGTDFSRFGPEIRCAVGPHERSCRLPRPEEIRKLIARIERFYKTNKTIHSPYSKYSLMIMREALRVLSGEKKSKDCLAGEGIAVVYPDGDVGLCELEAPVGNLSETGFDLERLLKQQENKKASKRGDKCACTHGCFLLLDILYHPLRLLRHKLLNLAHT